MTYCPDLTPYEYGPSQIPDGFEAFNLGWLEPEHDVPTSEGEPDPQLVDKLVTIAADHRAAVMRGFQRCWLPHPDGEDFPFESVWNGRTLFLGNSEIHVVASDGRLLAAPALVLHYIRDHHYRPPEDFIEAVKAMRIAPNVQD